jgi:hypothetical protein
MKYIKLLHKVLGVIPFIWFISFLLILLIGTINLGYVPKYGNLIDPYALNIDILSSLHVFCAFLAYIAFYLWLTLSAIFLVFFKKEFSLNKLSTVLFIIGVVGFFIFKYIFTDVFLWVVD